MAPKKTKTKPQNRNTERIQLSLYPIDLTTFTWYRDQLPKSLRNNSAAFRALLLEVTETRLHAGRPIPPWFEEAIAELS